jgi:hypothetical protein
MVSEKSHDAVTPNAVRPTTTQLPQPPCAIIF